MIFHVYQADDGKWHWRLETADEAIVARSARAYLRKEDCRAAIQLVKAARMAQVREHDPMWQSSTPGDGHARGPMN